MAKKKILAINWRDIKNPEAGGAELYHHEIFKRLNERDYEVTFLSHRVKGLPNEEFIDGVRTVRIGNKFLFNFSVHSYVKKHCKEYDLVVENLNKIPFFTPTCLKGTKSLHMVMHFFRKSIFRETVFPIALYVYLMERAVALFYRNQNFLAISESTKAEIDDMGIRYKQMFVVEPGIDTEYFHPTEAKANPPVISYVGRLMKYKNAQFVISAMPRLNELVPGIQLQIAGSGDFRPAPQNAENALSAQPTEAAKVPSAHDHAGFPLADTEHKEAVPAVNLFVLPHTPVQHVVLRISRFFHGILETVHAIAGNFWIPSQNDDAHRDLLWFWACTGNIHSFNCHKMTSLIIFCFSPVRRWI